MTHYRMKNRVIHFTTKGLKIKDLGDVILRGIPHGINMGCQALRMFCFNALLLAIADKTAVAGLSIADPRPPEENQKSGLPYILNSFNCYGQPAFV